MYGLKLIQLAYNIFLVTRRYTYLAQKYLSDILVYDLTKKGVLGCSQEWIYGNLCEIPLSTGCDWFFNNFLKKYYLFIFFYICCLHNRFLFFISIPKWREIHSNLTQLYIAKCFVFFCGVFSFWTACLQLCYNCFLRKHITVNGHLSLLIWTLLFLAI